MIDFFVFKIFEGSLVAVKKTHRREVELTSDMKKELLLVKELSHDNINRLRLWHNGWPIPL